MDIPIENGNFSVQSIIEFLKIPAEETKIIFVNGNKATLESRINSNDLVVIFPPIGGG